MFVAFINVILVMMPSLEFGFLFHHMVEYGKRLLLNQCILISCRVFILVLVLEGRGKMPSGTKRKGLRHSL